MMIDVVRRIVPRRLREKLGIWLESKVVRSRLLAFVFYYLLYGAVVKLLPEDNCLAAFHGAELIMPRETVATFIEVFRDRVYERFSSPREGDTVIDVGAHVGTFTVKAAELVGNKGLVVAIEPEPKNLYFLSRNIESHDLKNVKVIRKAVLDRAGEARLYLSEYSNRHSLLHSSNNYVEVEIDCLDNIIDHLGLEHVDFVKIDVEGAELEALRGARRILASPGIKLSIAAYHSLPDGQPELSSIVSYLAFRGFQPQIYKKRDLPYIYATKRDRMATVQQRKAIHK
ncbi:MAG TPA: FkbM family methyltransferase [Dehalococcoidia bacterium]|nr:FkbM family methyltransferase [Dehalococcoidia bacterium]